jgi:predicted enzyme related to lactoylglutathione lyase
MISAVGKVVVPVDDQERARRFWTEKAGFAVTTDAPYGDERWIEVAPPGGGPVLILSPRAEPEREVPERLPHSPVMFTCDDLAGTHRELAARGVEFPAPPERMHFGWWSMFCDEDGTRFALGQWG